MGGIDAAVISELEARQLVYINRNRPDELRRSQ
jgi:hypothetical protein